MKREERREMKKTFISAAVVLFAVTLVIFGIYALNRAETPDPSAPFSGNTENPPASFSDDADPGSGESYPASGSSDTESSDTESFSEISADDPSSDESRGGQPSMPPEVSLPEKDPNKKYVAFTFDDGPYTPVTSKILDKLEQTGGRATFFAVGNRVNPTTGAVLKRASEMGCEIGSHSYTHTAYFHNCTDEQMKSELEMARKAIAEHVGTDVMCMRPPGGSITERRQRECGYAVILWSVDSQDWKLSGKGDGREENIRAIADNVLSTVKDGDIILMHDLYENTYEAFCIIADTLRERGYELVTVSELLELDESCIGRKYYRAGLWK